MHIYEITQSTHILRHISIERGGARATGILVATVRRSVGEAEYRKSILKPLESKREKQNMHISFFEFLLFDVSQLSNQKICEYSCKTNRKF